MAQVAPEEVYAYEVTPEGVIEQAREAHARAVSYAFGEPVVFYEYMEAVAALARRAGLLNLLHSAGYIAPEPLRALCPLLDAANIDFKSFDPAFYRDVCGGELGPVLETLRELKRAGVHLEITHIVIPTLNDDPAQTRALCRWIRTELGPEVPLHVARFYPLYKLANLPPTPVRTLDRAREIAMEEGLEYVYVARVTGHEGENTFCPNCREPIIRRLGFVVEDVRLKQGCCPDCGHRIPGRWA
jgi:pyruvate formate lyase activating enzyme